MAEEGQAPVDRASFDRLLREHALLQRDFDRLLQCLGHLRMPLQSSSQFHTLKFEAARRRSPLGPDSLAFPGALTIGPLRLVQQLCGGREEMLVMREVSTRSRACAETLFADCELYVCGGLDSIDGSLVKGPERFRLQAGAWDSLEPSPVNRAGGAGAVLDGHFYACGCHGEFGRTAQRFNRARQKWELLGSMNRRRHSPAAAVVGGRLYICGGEDHVEGMVHDSIEFFDASAPTPRKASRAGAWRLLPSAMSAQRRSFVAAAIAGQGGRQDLFVCGGKASPSSQDDRGVVVLKSAEGLGLLGRAPRQWHLPPMAGPRGSHVAASLRGRVYVCGGHTGNALALSTVECFDPACEAWSSSPPMQLGRGEPAAAVMAGRLYVLGGWRSYQPGVPAECSVQRFDPATGLWEVLPWELLRGRYLFCAGATWRGALLA